MVEGNLDKLYKILESVYEDLDKAKDLISKLQLEARKEALKDIPGVEGTFDGKYLISDSNEKIEIPANYAAKSRIVYGDRLKMYEENGTKMFKQVEKVSRKKLFAIVSKKEGKFFALTEHGDHELSPTAVEFNNIKVGEKVQVILPENNLKSPFATLDKSLDQEEVSKPKEEDKNLNKSVKKEAKKEEHKDSKKLEKEPKVEKSEKSENAPAKKPQEFVVDLTNKVSEPVVLDISKPKEVVKTTSTTPDPIKSDDKKKQDLKPFILDEDDLR